MKLETLKDLYITELKDLYSAEKQIVKALPKMIKATKHPELKAAFKTHLQQTNEHVARIEKICKELGTTAHAGRNAWGWRACSRKEVS